MKQGWEIKKLGEVAVVSSGNSAPQKEELFENGIYPFIRTSDVGQIRKGFIRFCNDYLNEDGVKGLKLYKKGTILFPKSGASTFLNHRVMMEIDGYVSSHLATIKGNNSIIDDRFLLYFLTTIDARNLMQDIAYPSLKTSEISLIPIPYPPLPEQQRIVAILDEAFAAIAKAKANAEQNLKNAKNIFDSYLHTLFTKLFQTREKKIISDVAKVIGGYSFKSTDFLKEGKYQVIRMGNVRPGVIREKESPVFIDELDEKALTKALLQLNDVIITQTGTKKKRDYGFTVIIEKKNYLLNQRIASIRFSDKYLPKFFLYFSWTNLFKDQYFANETGTVGQGNVGIGAITDAEVPFIPVKEQKEIIDRIDELRIETQKLEAIYQKKINDLEELKKSILQKAFSGELETEKTHHK